jgi:ERCC4-type nuclease
MIIVDSREHGDFSEYERKLLPLGDFHFIRDGKVLLIVERKTINDYALSIKDGRLHEQCFRLREFRNSNPNSGIAYILEGSLSGTEVSPGISLETVKNSAVNKSVHFGIPVFYTASLDGTKALLRRLEKSVESLELTPESGEKIEKNYLGCSKVKKSTEENAFERILMTIPGVSDRIAGNIKSVFGNLPALLDALRMSGSGILVDVGGVGRKVGVSLAERIDRFLRC